VLYQQACNAHDEDGCAYLGASYRDGRGVPEDKDKGAQLLANACDAGSAEGCKFLGFAYREGIGLPPDAARATTAFETSCKLGDSAACGFAASGQKDPSRAIALLTQACDGGDAFFCQTLGARYLTGDGVSADRNRAVELLKRACASSDKDFDRKAACDFAGDLEDTRSRSTPMTSQVAGFRFGMTLNEFTATCTRSAHHITESTPAGTFCDGAAAGVGFDVESTGATFCEGKICSFIVVRSTPRGETEPERERVYDDLGARLSSRYGDAKKRVPDEGVTRTAWGWSVADSALQSDLILLMTHEKKGYELVILYRNRAAIVRDAATRHHQDTNL
jgi:hypothetical protein